MATWAESTSTALLECVRRNEPLAWRQLCQLYGPLVYAWCRKLGISPSDTPDVAQEVFRSVHGHVAGFRRDQPGQSFRAWLWTITRNKARDFFRSRAGREIAIGGTDAQLRLLDHAEEPDSHSFGSSSHWQIRPEVLLGLETVRAEFEDRTWQAFWRTAVDEIPTATVAQELQMSVNAVRLARSRVLRRLRETLDED